MFPMVQMAVFILKPTPFLEEFLGKLSLLRYPKSNIDTVIYSAVPSHFNAIASFGEKLSTDYHSVKIRLEIGIDERAVRTNAVSVSCPLT